MVAGKEPIYDEYVPWYIRAYWSCWIWITWPFSVREMKKAGFRRIGWMTWETGSDDSGEESDAW